jgi:hypothetical protein
MGKLKNHIYRRLAMKGRIGRPPLIERKGGTAGILEYTVPRSTDEKKGTTPSI